ncbi:unnamed protein product [Cylindrotheca closterium]|uniref:Uncharacterized protein n=1 Tax=Cylindrotheca closterium TaxID=2856 RepID=A0AAD2G4S6_9STRA|nr:unnamed protein product [Cylindrotheca closterium]
MNRPKPILATSPERRVTINPTVQIVETLNLEGYTPSEIAAAWYDEEAMDKITQRCFKVLQRMEECGGTKNGQRYCTRGLEGHTTLGSISKKKTRTAAYAAVLNEQEMQWNENRDIDVQAISDAYIKTTASSQLWAQVIGNRDHQAIQAYLYQEEEEEENEGIDARATTAALTCPILSSESSHSQPTEDKVPRIAGRRPCARAA